MRKQNIPREAKRMGDGRGCFALPVSLPIPPEILCVYIYNLLFYMYAYIYIYIVCVQSNKMLYCNAT